MIFLEKSHEKPLQEYAVPMKTCKFVVSAKRGVFPVSVKVSLKGFLQKYLKLILYA